MSPTDLAVQDAAELRRPAARRQRFQHPGRDRQRLGQPDRQPRPAAVASSRWASRCRARTCSRRTSPGCPPGTPSAPASTATSRRKKEVDFLVAMNPETAKEDVLTLEPGAAVVYDEPLKLNALRNDLVVLSGAVRQAGRAGLPRRQAAPPRAQHDLRRRPGEAARHRPGADGEGARQAARQEGQGASR